MPNKFDLDAELDRIIPRPKADSSEDRTIASVSVVLVPDGVTVSPDAELIAACAEAMAASQAYDAAAEADAADETLHALYGREQEAFERTRNIRATTTRGLREKAILLDKWSAHLECAPLVLSIAKDAVGIAEAMYGFGD
jgi:hypothetical protein